MLTNISVFLKSIPEKNINIFSFFLSISSLLFLFSPFTLITNIFIAVFVTNILFLLPGNFSFAFALISLVATMFAVLFKKDVWAENFAILVYYLLVAGVFIEFIHILLEKINAQKFFAKYFKKTTLFFESKFKNLAKYRIVIQKIED